jgi:hypothetical protein
MNENHPMLRAMAADLERERFARRAIDQALLEAIAERGRLQAVVDVADDFWPLIETIHDAALATWEYDDPRMKYVTVQISKVDLPTLRAALVKDPTREDT